LLLFAFAAAAFACSVLALWTGRRLALWFGFSDKPGGRKKHEEAVPPVGGLAIIPVFLLFTWFTSGQAIVPWPLAAGLCVLLVMGAVDDARGLKSQVKFAVMLFTATFVVIAGEMQISSLGNLFGFGPVELGLLSKGFTILSLALLMNAINMMDGVDGLAGGFCALVSLAMMAVCAMTERWDVFWILAILFGALAGFLIFNMRSPWNRKASVFLGDAGALCLGLLLGWFCIALSQGGGAPLNPATVIWIIAIPVMDAFALFLARSLRGLHPFNADRRHLHHRFLDAGIAPSVTTGMILGLIAFFALCGFMAQLLNVPEFVLFYLWLALFILHTGGILHPKGYTLLTRALRLRRRS